MILPTLAAAHVAMFRSGRRGINLKAFVLVLNAHLESGHREIEARRGLSCPYIWVSPGPG